MMDPATLAVLLPLPFLTIALMALVSRRGHNAWLAYAGLIAGVLTLVMVVGAWSSTAIRHMWAWFDVGGISIAWTIIRDPLSLTIAALVGGIGAFVFLYSGGYLEKTEDLRRYYALLALFASSMISAVIAGDLIQLLFSWEIVGVTSFLLIGFWHRKDTAVHAARKAFLTIIIGDAALLGGIIALAIRYATTDILTILANAQPDTITLIAGIGILIGAMTKSAQFPFHDWLPDAMEGPTPVSAFLHSATMVKAGIFLVARMLPLLLLVGLGPWIVLLALITMLLAAGIALVETDIKRVLAYSTMNHLGIMLLALGLGAGLAALTHLLMHSITKAMLFFAAGILIHAAGTQDLTRMRFAWRSSAVVCAALGALALAGVPPLAAALSKDAVLEAAIAANDPVLLVAFATALIIGAAYLIRWVLLITAPTTGGDRMRAHADWRMRAPLPVLAALAVGGGIALGWLHAHGVTAGFHLGWSALAALCLAIIGGSLAYAATRATLLNRLAASPLAAAARERFLVGGLYDLVARATNGAGTLLASFDDAVVNRSTHGVANITLSAGRSLRRMVTGRAATYALAIIIGAFLLLLLVRWSP